MSLQHENVDRDPYAQRPLDPPSITAALPLKRLGFTNSKAHLETSQCTRSQLQDFVKRSGDHLRRKGPRKKDIYIFSIVSTGIPYKHSIIPIIPAVVILLSAFLSILFLVWWGLLVFLARNV